MPAVRKFNGTLRMLWQGGRQLDGHPAMADASTEHPYASTYAKFLIYRQAVLMTPKPEHRARKKFSQLFRRSRIPMVVARVILMMAQDYNSARIIFPRARDCPQPFYLLGPKRTVRFNEIFQERSADGFVPGVQCYETPIFVFHTEETGLLAARLAMRY